MTLEIIGPGFGRTGTNSLKVALEHLGFGPAHHMFEVRDNPGQLPAWEALANGDDKPDWDAIFRGYRSQVDWPGARYWRELAAYYPDARVVLTVRDADAWFDSLEATISPFLAGRGNYDAHLNGVASMANKLVADGVFNGRMRDRAYATALFNAHIAEVQSTIPAARLLTFDVRQGWEPLCAFLDCPVPAISFPRLNSSRQFVEDEWANATGLAS